MGSRDAAATVAAACLRYLSLVPEFVDEFTREWGLRGRAGVRPGRAGLPDPADDGRTGSGWEGAR
jgi:hypothetical protein